ncbi:hypothetical protein BDZ94DRAFT_1118838, partial [Collybia nuda]
MEIGSPMASLYLLGNPDHYTSHTFKIFWWKSYVSKVKEYWEDSEMDDDNMMDDVILSRYKEDYIGTSTVDDYVLRPHELEHISLYQWIKCCSKVKFSQTQ